MIFPSWAIAAALAGGFGAVGGAIGWALGKLGVPFSKYLTIALVVAGALIARSPVVDDLVTQYQWTDERVAEHLGEQLPALFPYLKTEFPDDYADVVRKMTDAIHKDGKAAFAGGVSFQIMSELRRKYAKYMTSAPVANHIEILKQQNQVLKAIQLTSGELACANYAVNGPAVLNGDPVAPDYLEMLEKQAVSNFQAFKTGMQTPVERREPTEEDWLATGDAMVALGTTDAEFEALDAMNADNPLTCAAVMKMHQTMIESESPSVDLVRASYLTEMAAS